MKKVHIIGLAAVLLLTGCQGENQTEAQEEQPIVIDAPIDEATTDEVAKEVTVTEDGTATIDREVTGDSDAVVSEIHEWTESDQQKLDAFANASDQLSLKEAKEYLDTEIVDVSSMVADEYIAYYEGRLIDDLGKNSDLFFEGSVQEDLMKASDYSFFSVDQLDKIENESTRKLIEPLFELGYKVEMTEGMYYPIIDYSILYHYEDKVTSGVKDYLRLMKRESDIMAYNDGGIVVPWSELGERVLMGEALLEEHLPNSMMSRAKENFKWNFMSFVFGSDNTPVYDYDSKEITDDAILESFVDVSYKGGDRVKNVMSGYLKALEMDNYKGTDQVYETVNALLKDIMAL